MAYGDDNDYSGFGKYAYSVYWGINRAQWPMANGYYRTKKEAMERAKLERRRTGHKYAVKKVEHRASNPGMRYTVTSSSGTVTPHRTKAAATKEYFRRYHKGDTWIQLSDRETGKVLRESKSKIVSPAKRGSYTFSGGEYKRNNPGGPLDTHAARELELFIENDADLYRQQYTPINKNLVTKMARGVYNHAGAVKLFGYLMESGAKKYIKQHGSVHPYTGRDEWHQVFSPATRKAAAERFADHFEVEAKLGNYDSLLPKKYSDWRLKSNPGRLTDVLVKRGGRTFRAKAKYDAKVGRVRVFVNPRVAKAAGVANPGGYVAQRSGSGYTVTVSRSAVERFKRSWPASGLPSTTVKFHFDRGGDLVDITPSKVADKFDGSAALALSHDAQNYAVKRFGLPSSHVRG